MAKGRLQCQERAAFASGVGRTKTAFLEGLEGFGGFDGWQAASLNAKKKLLGWALVPLPAGLGLPKRHLEGLEGFGGFDGWQTAGFNAKKKLLGWAMGFGAFACGVRGPKMHLEGLEFL